MNQHQATLHAKARGIVDLAERENRDLTAAEAREFNDALRQIEASKGQSAPSSLSVLDRFPGSPGRRTDGEPLILRPSDRLVDALRHTWPQDVEPESLSLTRFVSASLSGDWSRAPREKRYMDTMGVSTGSGGGYLVPSPLAAQLIDNIRAQAVCQQLGAVTVPMDSSELRIAKWTSDPSGSWRAENTAATFSDATAGAVTLHAKTLLAATKVSVELIEDSAPSVEDALMRSLSASLALELDRVCLVGGATGNGLEPVGISVTPGVVSTSIGTAIQWTNVLDSLARLWASNVEASGLVWTPSIRRTWAGLLDGEGRPAASNLPVEVAALQKLSTSQLTSGVVIVGDFKELLIGVRTNITIEASREAADTSGSAFANYQVWVRAALRADVALRHEQSFDVLTGVS